MNLRISYCCKGRSRFWNPYLPHVEEFMYVSGIRFGIMIISALTFFINFQEPVYVMKAGFGTTTQANARPVYVTAHTCSV